MECSVCVIFQLGSFASSIGEKHSVWHISIFGVRFLAHCIHCAYRHIAYMGTVVLTGKISFLHFAYCVYHVMLTFHIYPNTLSYQVVAVHFPQVLVRNIQFGIYPFSV